MTPIGDVTVSEYPLDAHGELVPIPSKRPVTRWARNDPFKATMRYLGVQRTSASNLGIWRGDDGREWTMPMADMDWLLRHAHLAEGETTGWWRVRKRGNSFGLEWLGAVGE